MIERRYRSRPGRLAAFALPLALASCSGGSRDDAPAAATSRSDVHLTVYNADFALVRETRTVELSQGRTTVQVSDVSRLLDPTSVLLSWPTATNAQVVATAYDLGVDSTDDLLQRYLGREVEMIWRAQDGRVGQTVRGTLQVTAGGDTVLQTGDGLLVNGGGAIVAPTSASIVTIPQLGVEIESQQSGEAPLSVAYLTRGLAWSADYVATLDPSTDALSLECWATVTNNTGANFPKSEVTLVAGTPNRAVRGRTSGGFPPAEEMDMSNLAKREDQGLYMNKVEEPIATGELYAYKVKAKSDITNGRMNRLRMIHAPNVVARRDYSIRLPHISYWEWMSNGAPMNQNAQLAIAFANKEDAGLGLPLPEGAVRVYEPSKDGVTYVGAAAIGNTPDGNRVDLTISSVFDLTCQYRVVSKKRIDRSHVRIEVEVLVRNAKTKEIPVRMVMEIGSDTKVLAESHKGVKLDAVTRQWSVPAAAEKETKLTMTLAARG